MQCVILAAGKGTRMRPLTDEKPKPLIEVAGKPILEHIVRALPAVVDEIVLIVGYKANAIRDYCGDEYLGKKVTYRQQENHAGGTGDALLCAKDVITGKFLFMYGDDIHGSEALQKAAEQEHAMLSAESEHPERYGVITKDEADNLIQIEEKPEQPKSNLVNIGGYVLSPKIFDYESPVSHLNEILATDMVTSYAKDYPVKVLVQDVWIPIGYPEDIEKAERVLNRL